MTATTMPMMETHPQRIKVDRAQLAAAIDAIAVCTQACIACADACMSERTVAELSKCVRINLDCADVCAATIRVLLRQGDYDAKLNRALLEACVTACRSCGDECSAHAKKYEHCRICAEACRACEEACRRLLTAMA
ncbi:four-helix bundle copper-binding protein [Dactylosporangium sp. NPDC000244]|uniref:four-helix bundle copper-binding protein n=1 Tax=Dactylosporangium sp. NPDC000244 TaxID=3154365 RepID=UPI00331C81B1